MPQRLIDFGFREALVALDLEPEILKAYSGRRLSTKSQILHWQANAGVFPYRWTGHCTAGGPGYLALESRFGASGL